MKDRICCRASMRQFVKNMLLAVGVGIAGGIFGNAFSHAIAIVTSVRVQHEWLIWLLPLGGLFIVWMDHAFHTTGIGTNQVFCCTEEAKEKEIDLPPALAPFIYFSSVVSHLFGASVGREGAALQLGGGIAACFGQVFHLSKEETRLLVYSGMAACFSAVFGTPLAAFVFVLEVIWIGHLCLPATLPAFVASFTAYGCAKLTCGHPDRFPLHEVPEFSWPLLGKVLLIAAAAAVIAEVFCLTLKISKKIFTKFFPNPYLRILVGGAVTALLTFLIGTTAYNGAGLPVIEAVFEHGSFENTAFLWKWLFTCLALGAGYRGGEIIPSLFIGATFGALAASVLGISPVIGAAVAMTALFCGVTNAPVAAFFLAAELFSFEALWFIAAACIVSFPASGKVSLYSAQKYDGIVSLFRKTKS